MRSIRGKARVQQGSKLGTTEKFGLLGRARLRTANKSVSVR